MEKLLKVSSFMPHNVFIALSASSSHKCLYELSFIFCTQLLHDYCMN